ncbi:MAG: hypothetical protein A4S09_17470 [Proteobacteria bacterium SG_bin7]|nr:MAG: hypothetical protein A4S09_17470 [Proteobacteria bacterium SG_bin7]
MFFRKLMSFAVAGSLLFTTGAQANTSVHLTPEEKNRLIQEMVKITQNKFAIQKAIRSNLDIQEELKRIEDKDILDIINNFQTGAAVTFAAVAAGLLLYAFKSKSAVGVKLIGAILGGLAFGGAAVGEGIDAYITHRTNQAIDETSIRKLKATLDSNHKELTRLERENSQMISTIKKVVPDVNFEEELIKIFSRPSTKLKQIEDLKTNLVNAKADLKDINKMTGTGAVLAGFSLFGILGAIKDSPGTPKKIKIYGNIAWALLTGGWATMSYLESRETSRNIDTMVQEIGDLEKAYREQLVQETSALLN